jgi:Rrf2 family iron-sulfur cluster assembly transcriptional regulator
MSLLPRRGLYAIAAVIDVALHGRDSPVSARMIAARHGLPPRHLEPVLQALVHDGILRGLRGPRGGYELGRERRRITVDDILRAVANAGPDGDVEPEGSPVVVTVVLPAVAEAERAFAATLAKVNVEELARRAEIAGESGAAEDLTVRR